jgi:hypothetical protein
VAAAMTTRAIGGEASSRRGVPRWHAQCATGATGAQSSKRRIESRTLEAQEGIGPSAASKWPAAASIDVAPRRVHAALDDLRPLKSPSMRPDRCPVGRRLPVRASVSLEAPDCRVATSRGRPSRVPSYPAPSRPGSRPLPAGTWHLLLSGGGEPLAARAHDEEISTEYSQIERGSVHPSSADDWVEGRWR